MADNEVLNVLANMEFLDGVSPKHLERLAETGKLVELPPGKILFHEGEPADSVFFVAEGDIALEIYSVDAGNRRITTVAPGYLLGWASLLRLGRLTATARALTDVRAVEIPNSDVLTMCEEQPDFGVDFMGRVAGTLARRLAATRRNLLDVFGQQLPIAEEVTAPVN